MDGFNGSGLDIMSLTRQEVMRRKYRKKVDQFVIAVQLDLETEGFYFYKWGNRQFCKPGDWLVNNQGDVYTVDMQVFARTYKQTGPGQYLKITPVWAERADKDGSVKTKEGVSDYLAGDYLAFNQADGGDGYCVTAEKFESMYEPAD